MSENVLILNRVREIAGDVLETPVTDESTPDTVESWDSVRHLNLMLALESEYGFELSPEDMDAAKSIGQIAQLVASKRA
jgi:acyl carrier protein